MAAGKIKLQSDAGGVTSVSIEAGVTNGELVLPSSGTVVSVAGAVTDNAIARYDSTTGKLQNSGVTIDDNGNIGSGTQSFNGFGGSGFKNYIINGNFDIWQYGVSQTSYGYGSDDRWFNVCVGSTRTHSQVACTDTERALFNASYFSRTVVSSVVGDNNEVGIRQSIEDITKLAGKIVTISFWARADGNKKLGYRIFNLFGTGGSPTAQYSIATNTLDITSTWQKKTITVAIPSIVGKTTGTDGIHTTSTNLKFFFDAGTSAASLQCPSMIQQSGTFDIAQVQLEEGSVATPFEQRPYGLELSLCQRYYQRGFQNRGVANAYAIGYVSLRIPLHTSMRVIPTISQVQGTTLDLAIEVIGIGRATPTSMVFGGVRPNALQVDFGYTSLDNQIKPVTLDQDIIQCSAEL